MKRLTLLATLMPLSAHGSFVTGNEMVELCQENNQACSAYIAGVADGIDQAGISFCLPDSLAIGQARDVVFQYISGKPQILNESAAMLVHSAFIEAYSC